MGCGVPYAIAAKFAHPDRVAIALVGDGAMQMNGLNELITIAKYWQRWSDPRLVVLDRKSTRLNSSHANISYAVFCLKKKMNKRILTHLPIVRHVTELNCSHTSLHVSVFRL